MKKNILLAFAVLTVFAGCGKDFLNEAPKLSQDNDKTLSSVSDLDLATAGNYGVLVHTGWYGEDFILLNEMTTANGKRWIGKHDSGRLKDIYALNIRTGSTDETILWRVAYGEILGTNNVLNRLEAVEGDETLKNNLKAENLFLRALAYFDLVRTYGRPYDYTADASHLGVPIVYDGDYTNKPQRSPVSEVYKLIVSDLTTAESLIGDNYIRTGFADPRASASKPAIQALLSRVYLYMGNYDKCIEYSTKVINNKAFSMWTVKDVKDAACFKADVSDPKNKGEVIFEVYGLKTNTNDGFHDSLWSMTAPDGEYGDAGASTDVLTRYEDGDIRKTWFSPDKNGECLFTLKYSGKGLSTPDVTNTIVLRLSEMYLNRAEAAIKGGKGGNPTADLKVLADNRGTTPQPATREGVFAEREKELVWEGHLWFDLARYKLPMVRVDVADGIATKLEPDDHRWVAPIAIRELNTNGNLVQNPGYAKE